METLKHKKHVVGASCFDHGIEGSSESLNKKNKFKKIDYNDEKKCSLKEVGVSIILTDNIALN